MLYGQAETFGRGAVVKRLVVILILFAVMMGFAAGELVYTTKFYSVQYEKLTYLKECFDADPKNLDNASSKAAYEDAFSHWEKGKRYVMMLGNHNAVKFVDEKYVSLRELIRLNQESDAYVALTTSLNYIEDLKQDNYPLLPNLL